MKRSSIFYSDRVLERVDTNVKQFEYGTKMQKQMVDEAEPWMRYTDDELWDFVFGPTLSRSVTVWTEGYCPSCRKDTPMRTWVFDPFAHPWKAGCPHCGDWFPKNDFHSYYVSGLDQSGIFRAETADKSLLYNSEHPDPEDSLHSYGVDDSEGYVDPQTGNRWRFIAAYLLYGQWKKLIVEGMEKLANAYIVTRDEQYSRKTGILLNRIADMFPDYNFLEQGYCYEKRGNHAGYVGTHYDSNFELCSIALSYDKVFDGIQKDEKLLSFLTRKAFETGHHNRIHNFNEVQNHIEERIFRHAISNRPKLTLNFPATDTLLLLMRSVLDWHEQDKRKEIIDSLTDLVSRGTAEDGVTGEKGLANYSAMTIHKLSEFLAYLNLADDRFLVDMVQELPQLRKTYKFFIDTWCLESYYPLSGDTGSFASPTKVYRGVRFENTPRLNGNPEHKISTDPSMYTHIWNMYKITGDTSYIKVMYKSNNCTLDMFPYDVTAPDPGGMLEEVHKVIVREGAELELASVNKEQWHLAILRSGKGESGCAVWLDYDSGYSHGHCDGMNLGLFAKGLDLMPDFGYVPIQYGGGWYNPRTKWYISTAGHNTVVVDGQNTIRDRAGHTALWATGDGFKAIRASGKELIDKQKYERTVALVDISSEDSYVLDLFRVAGGKDHAKFMGSHFGTITTSGLELSSAEDYGHETLMRNFMGDENPKAGWSVDWQVEDYLGVLKTKRDIHLRYTDLTSGAAAYTAEGWVSPGGTSIKDEQWIPRIMVRKQAEEESLCSTFVSILEPYEGNSNISKINRLALSYEDGSMAPDCDAAVEVILADGRKDLIISVDAEFQTEMQSPRHPRICRQSEWEIVTDSELCFVRKGAAGIEKLAFCKGSFLIIGNIEIKLENQVDYWEMK